MYVFCWCRRLNTAYFFFLQGFPFLRFSPQSMVSPFSICAENRHNTGWYRDVNNFSFAFHDIFTADYIFHWWMLLFACFRTFVVIVLLDCVRMTTWFNMRVLHVSFHDERVTISHFLSKCKQIWVSFCFRHS